MNRLIKKESKDLNGHLAKDEMKMANKRMKRDFTSYVFGEMQIKTRKPPHASQKGRIWNTGTATSWRDYGATGPLAHRRWAGKR